MSLQASVGVYHQAPDSADLSRVFGNPALAAELGIHYVAGIEVKATPTLHLDAQGFYKDLRNLMVRGVAARPIRALEDDGVGRVYGGELLVRQELWRTSSAGSRTRSCARSGAIIRAIRGACSSTTRRTS